MTRPDHARTAPRARFGRALRWALAIACASSLAATPALAAKPDAPPQHAAKAKDPAPAPGAKKTPKGGDKKTDKKTDDKKGDKKVDKKGDKKADDKKTGKKQDAASKPAPARPPAAAAKVEPLRLDLAIAKVTLDNGLRVVMNVDRTSPTIAVSVAYDVGFREEERGERGFAGLLARMMLEGSANVPRGSHLRLVATHGGKIDGATSAEHTIQVAVLPASELALALWLEADRMKALDLTQEGLDRQRKVLEEEHRTRVSSTAYAASAIRLEELVFQGYPPYEHATEAAITDVAGARLDAVGAFHARHHAPNGAVLSIAGDFDADEAMTLVRRYFEAIPRGEAPSSEGPTLPEQTSQRTAVLTDASADAPGLLYGWPIPGAGSADHHALAIAARILGDGASSRLHERLVRDASLARTVSVGTLDRRGPDLFRVEAELARGAAPGDAGELIEAEIKALATRGPTDAELARAQRGAQAALIVGLQTNAARATRLGAYELSFGDARLLGAELPKIFAVTKDDVKRAVAAHLGPMTRSIVETHPPAPPPGDEAAAPKPERASKRDAKKTDAKKTDAKKPHAKKPDAKKQAPAKTGKKKNP